jgi:hypothetical protein
MLQLIWGKGLSHGGGRRARGNYVGDLFLQVEREAPFQTTETGLVRKADLRFLRFAAAG